MRYTRTAQGLLNAQYRSVLKKCLMINLGLFALGANVAGAEDFILKAEDLSTSKNITWKEISAAEYKSDNPNMLKVELSADKTQYFEYTYTQPEGGKVYNTHKDGKEGALTGDITADFKDSTSGALSNAAGNTLNITGDFLNNQIDNIGSDNWGGAVYNEGTLSIKGDMINNHIVRNGDVYGGAIYNVSNNANIKEIIGNYIGNYLVSNSSHAYGGAIFNYNKAKIGKIEGKFIGNCAIGNLGENNILGAGGGAIVNLGSTIKSITGEFINNYTQNASGQSDASGGAIVNSGANGVIGSIEAVFINNYSTSLDGRVRGGAIFNSTDSHIGDIKGKFSGNHLWSKTESGGGAVLNIKATMDNIYADFTNNYVYSEGCSYGGALANLKSVDTYDGEIRIKDVVGNFINNYAEAKNSWSEGGAIYNSSAKMENITGNFINNYAEAKNSYALGGAIYNESATIKNITGYFTGNYVKSVDGDVRSGAIYNQYAKMGDITADFTGNYALSETNMSNGGAVVNLMSTINKIKGNFTNNYALSGGRASGGAVNNSSGIIGSITGDFDGNYAESNGGVAAARGGALLSFGDITNLTANFSNNHALTNGTFAIGGAVANMFDSSLQHGITTLSGNFSNNFAQTTGAGNNAYAQGGAIYNASNIDDIKSSTFSNNFVSGASEQTDGGAIWNNGTIGFSGVNVFQNNYKIVNGEKTANDIYNSGTINVAENGSITLNGGVTGNGAINLAQNATLNINDATVSDNTLTLEKDAALAFNVNEINTADTVQSGGKIDSDIKLNADANLKVSTYVEHGSEAGEGSYTFANSVDTANGQWKLTTTIYNSLYNYDTNLNDENNTLNFTFKKKNATEIAQDFGTDKETADEILALTGGTSDNEQFNQISKAVNQKAQAGDQNLPNELNDLNDNTQGNLEAARSVNDILGKNIANRLNIRQNHNVYGLSGGDFSEYEPEIWANVLYQKAENSGAFDYTADTKGLIAAIDGKAGKNLTVGIGYAYQQTDLDSGSKSIDIDTHSVFGYAEYLKNHWFANGLVSYNMSSNNQTKQAFGVNISGDYDTDVLGTQLMAGREFYGCTENHILRLRPQAGLRYYKINQDGYTDSAGMNYNSTDSDVVTGVFGAEISDNTDYHGAKIMPKAFINATYDLQNDDSSMLVKLPNGTAYNVSQESNGKFGIEAGVGVEMAVTDNAKVGVSYEYDWRDDYSAHTGLLNLKYAF